MKGIYSKENPLFKLCKSLEQRKYRDRSGKFLIEGENLVREAIECGYGVEGVLVRSGEEEAFESILTRVDDHRVYVLSRELFGALAQTETSQGIMALTCKQAYSCETFAAEHERYGTKNFVVLDRLQDPGNIGTIIRTAEAAGYGLVVSMKGTADVFSPKVVRAAAGALLRMPIINVESVDRLLELAKLTGRKVVASAMCGELNYYEADLAENIALVVGNEGNGISDELLRRSDLKVRIPMRGEAESLNAAVAAGILMYEALRDK